MATSSMVDLSEVVASIPEPPSAELDPYLDAAQRCFQRFGLSRTTVPDIAREARVSRSTVYRVAGTVEQIALKVVIRDLHRFLAEAPTYLVGAPPDAVIDITTAFAQRWIDNPVVRRILEDDLDSVGVDLMREAPKALEPIADLISPLLEIGMRAGLVARRDPRILSEWISRMVFTVVVHPPPGDLRAYFAEILLPVLEPAPGRSEEP